jgi:4-hydroxybenzoate polyprenyltransferase
MKKDNRPLLVRLWEYQKERIPIFALLVFASLSVGVVYKFSSMPLQRYFVGVLIIILYLIQIRASDEKKDFEFDNIYHKDRPVQRGLVSLGELYRINVLVIVAFLF